MSRQKPDWALEEARRIVDLTGGLSREASVNYIAATLRLATQRGAIENAKINGAKKPAPKADTAEGDLLTKT